jgi:alkaline phosphatase D
MSVGRRDFMIGTLGAVAGSKVLLGCGDSDGSGNADAGTGSNAAPSTLALNATLFAHGVASGDPLADRVILWTRATYDGVAPLELEWAITSDAALLQILQRGTVTALPAADFTVKVDVTGLSAGTSYYYVFFAGSRGRSTIGRTRTLPTSSDHARIAFTSCANYQNGYFNAYRAIARRADLDVWIHLGDYIYEYKAGEYADASLSIARTPTCRSSTVSTH